MKRALVAATCAAGLMTVPCAACFVSIDDSLVDRAKSDAGDAGIEGATSGGYRAVIVGDRPIAYWRFGEKDGATVARDEIGGHDGAYVGARLGVPGAIARDPDTAVHFSALETAGSSMTVHDDALQRGGTLPYSVEVWIDPAPASTPEGAQGIGCFDPIATDQDVTGAQPEGWALFFNKDQNLVFNRSGGGTTLGPVAPLAPDGRYHYVLGTYDGATLKLYLDAVLVDQMAVNFASAPKTADLVVAVHPGVGTRCYSGDMDELAIYDRALGADDAQRHFAAAK